MEELCRRLYGLLKSRDLQSRIIHTDDTNVRMLKPPSRESLTARLRAYLGDSRQPYVAYYFTRDRSRDGPKNARRRVRRLPALGCIQRIRWSLSRLGRGRSWHLFAGRIAAGSGTTRASLARSQRSRYWRLSRGCTKSSEP